MQVKIQSKLNLKQILIFNTPEFALPFIGVLIYFALSGFMWGMFFALLGVCVLFYALAVVCIWTFTDGYAKIDSVSDRLTVRRFFKTKEYALRDTKFKVTLYADTETQFCYKLTLENGGKNIFSIFNTDMTEFNSKEFYEKLVQSFDCEITDKRKQKNPSV